MLTQSISKIALSLWEYVRGGKWSCPLILPPTHDKVVVNYACSKKIASPILLEYCVKALHHRFSLGMKPSWAKLHPNPSPWSKGEVKSFTWKVNYYGWTCALVNVLGFSSPYPLSLCAIGLNDGWPIVGMVGMTCIAFPPCFGLSWWVLWWWHGYGFM